MTKTKRNPAKIKRILKERGYKEGKPPKGKVAHHVKPLAKRGKDTRKNIRVVPTIKHKKIHKNRRKRGEV